MIYTAPREDPLQGQLGGGWALEIESFLDHVKWHRADRRVPSPIKKRIFNFRGTCGVLRVGERTDRADEQGRNVSGRAGPRESAEGQHTPRQGPGVRKGMEALHTQFTLESTLINKKTEFS
jgi:hypothetical protein